MAIVLTESKIKARNAALTAHKAERPSPVRKPGAYGRRSGAPDQSYMQEFREGLKQGPREPKTRRRELRLTASAYDLIIYAMSVSGLTPGDLAYEGARRVLEDHERRRRMERDGGVPRPVRIRPRSNSS